MLASFVAGPNAALDAAPEHRDQVPGFYQLKVGDLEVTALFDGLGVFHPHWLNGTKATMDGVAKALHEDPHLPMPYSLIILPLASSLIQIP